MDADEAAGDREILLTVQYDGAGFAGWQMQAEERTVQRVLHDAVEGMVQHPVTLRASSRLDAGVHCMGLPVTFSTGRDIPLEGLLRGLNRALPDDVAIVAVDQVATDWRVREAAVAKTYGYTVLDGPVRQPLWRRRAWHVRMDGELDVGSMELAATHLLGAHDFASFRKVGCSSTTTIRHMHEIRVQRKEGTPQVHFTVTGNAFLRNMVRILVGTLVEVGRGQRDPGTMGDVLLAADRSQAGRTAPGHGLTLLAVHFEGYPPIGKGR